MKLKILLVTAAAILTLFTKDIKSWDTTAAKFYPLAVGNSWSYNHKIFSPPLGCGMVTSQYNYIVSIVSDTIRNGHRYFKFNNGVFVRIDSITMNVHKIYLNNPECKTDSLLARKNDYIYNTCNGDPLPLGDTNLIFFAGQNRRTKTMYMIGGQRTLMYEIGLYLDGYCELGTGSSDQLNGAIINGVQYGTMIGTGISQISSEIPNQFSLSQNYPNPFNPRTVIRCSLPVAGMVTLKIYDVLGREVRTLVNEQLQAGTYEVDFDGSDLPSGVYYYKLETETFRETKKMVLIK